MKGLTPLAVNGPVTIAVVVLATLVLLYVLLRGERDYSEAPDQPQEHGDGAPRPPLSGEGPDAPAG